MSSIETLGLGAGSYPDNDLEDLYEYEFLVSVTATMKISAKSEEEAKAILEECYTPYEICSDSEELEIENIEMAGRS